MIIENKKIVPLPGGQLASASFDDTIKIWQTETGLKLQNRTGHLGIVNAALALLSGGQLVSGSYAQTVRVCWQQEAIFILGKRRLFKLSSFLVDKDSRELLIGQIMTGFFLISLAYCSLPLFLCQPS